ncbi:MAG: transglutaminase family protein [Leptolyngbyaceae cyanobacterium]
MRAYLQSTKIIDWQHPAVLAQAQRLAAGQSDPIAIAKACFEWVRDRIRHSVDYQMNPVTCKASEVLEHQTGYCYAKSHLLAALLRANGIPAGFCYQRLSVNDQGAPYCLHGLNGVYLDGYGWYRIDARGNNAHVNAQFTPPQAQLAYPIRLPEEADLPKVLAEPLPRVVQALQAGYTWDELHCSLPDVALADWDHEVGEAIAVTL